MKLPRINHWREPISSGVYAIHAERCWEDTPRYSVRMIVDSTQTSGYHAIEQIDAMLEAFEKKLVAHYGSARFLKYWQHYGAPQ